MVETQSRILFSDRVVKRFGGLVAVDDLTFDVRRGEILGIISPNGSGKTTMMNLISGALAPSAGTITLNGIPISGLAPHRINRRGVARTFQLVRILPGLSVIENCIAGLAFRSVPVWGEQARHEARQALERVGLTEQTETPVDALTYIDQKRLELARALASHPEVLLLDEWLAGLNPTELQEGIALVASLQTSGVTIILVEHVMDAIRSLCARVIVMASGAKIAEGRPEDVLLDSRVVEVYLGGDS